MIMAGIVPGHPRRWIGRQFAGVPLQLSQVVEGIGFGEFAGVDRAHEQIADLGAVQRAIEQSIFAMQDRAFECAFADIMPPPGLCRVLPLLTQPAWFLTVPDAA